MTRRKFSLFGNICIVLMVVMAWCRMMFRYDENGTLTAAGFGSLKYFTVQSNLLAGAAAALYGIDQMRVLRGKRRAVALWIHILKYVATVAVTLTFLTVMGFLGPVFGYGTMFIGANLWFHLVIPLTCVFVFCALEKEEPLTFRWTFVTVLPMLLYGGCYLANNLINGRGEGPGTNDWYGFLLWGWPTGLLIFAVLTLATWAAGLLIRRGNLFGSSTA